MIQEFDINRLSQAVADFKKARILVLGDVMLDRFIWGSVSRISPEAPVPVVQVDSETHMLGGAANVLHNIIALGGQACVCGLVGDDESGRQVAELLVDLDVDPKGLAISDERPTTVKTRVVASSQQVVRVDWERLQPLTEEELGGLTSYLDKQVADCDAVVVSDYNKGMINKVVMDRLLELAAQYGKLVAVDPKVPNMHLYKGATIVTPNHLEAASAAGISVRDENHVALSGEKLMRELGSRYVLITQGERGMTLFNHKRRTHIPTAAKRVFDVTGAGDTVISTLILGMVSGLSPEESAFLANIAAGVVVGEVGTSAVTGGRLITVLKQRN